MQLTLLTQLPFRPQTYNPALIDAKFALESLSPALIYAYLDLMPYIQPVYMPIRIETPHPAQVYAHLTLGHLLPILINAHLGLISYHLNLIYAC